MGTLTHAGTLSPFSLLSLPTGSWAGTRPGPDRAECEAQGGVGWPRWVVELGGEPPKAMEDTDLWWGSQTAQGRRRGPVLGAPAHSGVWTTAGPAGPVRPAWHPLPGPAPAPGCRPGGRRPAARPGGPARPRGSLPAAPPPPPASADSAGPGGRGRRWGRVPRGLWGSPQASRLGPSRASHSLGHRGPASQPVSEPSLGRGTRTTGTSWQASESPTGSLRKAEPRPRAAPPAARPPAHSRWQHLPETRLGASGRPTPHPR